MAKTEIVPDQDRFNYTIRYQDQLLGDLPDAAKTAIDAGCGEGLASRILAAAGLSVTGIDADNAILDVAKSQDTTGITYALGDVLTADLEPADVVYSGAMLHHVDLIEGLTRLRDLVAPGGRLLVVGMARNTWRDIPLEVAASIADKAWAFMKGRRWDSGAHTVWPPAHSYVDVRKAVAELLPGAQFKQRLMYRYTIQWDRSY